MKKLSTLLLLLLNVTNSTAIANCVTGYACSIKDLEQNNTNSVIERDKKIEKTKNNLEDINKNPNDLNTDKNIPKIEQKQQKQITNSIF